LSKGLALPFTSLALIGRAPALHALVALFCRQQSGRRFCATSPFAQTTSVPSAPLNHLTLHGRLFGQQPQGHTIPCGVQSFWQADASVMGRQGGSGLGLAISQRLCKAMGGSIRCVSRVGQGSRFWVDLPLPVSPAKIAPTPLDHPEPSGMLVDGGRGAGGGPLRLLLTALLSGTLRNKRVLFVEDNRVGQKVGLQMLQSLGCRVRLACNGQECVRAVETEDFDAILMDCQVTAPAPLPLASSYGRLT
jgi:CheY-like chemotaxis protein